MPRAAPLLSCNITLPGDFRVRDFLAFHQRDPRMLAEQTGLDSLAKGIAWHGQAACLQIRFQADAASAELMLDGQADPEQITRLENMVRRMLGLTQPVEAFEQAHRHDPHLGPLIARRPGLRVPLAATPFEALSWAVTGQQISVNAAIALRRRLIQATGLVHSSGLACYPAASQIAAMTEAALREAGFSGSKARTLLTLSEQTESGALPLDEWVEELPVDDIRTHLLRVRGIGPWTVNYALLRGFGWLDGSLHGDAAVRRGLQILLGSSEKIDEEQTRQWLAQFAPWRALVAAHLWAMQSSGSA